VSYTSFNSDIYSKGESTVNPAILDTTIRQPYAVLIARVENIGVAIIDIEIVILVVSIQTPKIMNSQLLAFVYCDQGRH
jgi:hypothetical protein